MKRLIVIAVLAGVLTAILATTALAAGPISGRWAQGGTTPNTATCPMAGGMLGRGMMGGAGMQGRPAWAGQPDEVETLLGMTHEQIHAERLAGKSLAQIAASKNVSEEKLIDTILAAKKSAIQQAVTDGRLAQARADLMNQNMQTMVRSMVERTTTGPLDRHGMMGGRGQGMRSQGMRGGYNF
jgi:hypothetical protein